MCDEEVEVLECLECGWIGDQSELVSKTSDIDDECYLCPNCGSDNVQDFE